ncbi:hypothetical protein AB0K43_30725 [Kitasatospora sp. NPDC049258]|uniref:hypothetical protein n=1 Tax=Kitasatospora sp. NPDC049258 TaxID=3155394 RepID=UPI0034259932
METNETTPAEPQYRANLSDLEPLAARWAARRDGRPMPPLDQAGRQALIRTLTEAAARGAAANPEAARLAQARADELRAGLD